MTIADKLNALINIKTAIKDAIVAKGVAIAESEPFSAYAEKINRTRGHYRNHVWMFSPNGY